MNVYPGWPRKPTLTGRPLQLIICLVKPHAIGVHEKHDSYKIKLSIVSASLKKPQRQERLQVPI
jgi:hypothetical protein